MLKRGKSWVSVAAIAASISAAAVAAFPVNAAASDEPVKKTLRIGGRVQIDYSYADAENANVQFNGSELRRLRIGGKGEFGSKIKYKFEVNTDSDNEVEVQDAYVQWVLSEGSKAKSKNGFSKPNSSIKVGHFKLPNSLDELTSSRFISTLERAAFTDAFGFGRRLGIGVNASGDNYSFAAGVFGDNLNSSSREEGYAAAARGVFHFGNAAKYLIHLGASVRHREAGDTQSDILYRQRPYAHIPGRILSTGNIAESDTFYGLEAAAMMDRAWLAGEYGMLNVNCSDTAMALGTCVDDPEFSGGYVEAGVFVKGKRTYDKAAGKFGRPEIDRPMTANGGTGAFSFVVRYDTIDMNDSGTNGGEYDAIIVGADWWPTDYTRLGINYFKVDADLGSTTTGLDPDFATLLLTGAQSEDVEGALVRTQFDF